MYDITNCALKSRTNVVIITKKYVNTEEIEGCQHQEPGQLLAPRVPVASFVTIVIHSSFIVKLY